LAHRPPTHWIRAADEMVEQDAETVDVAPNCRSFPPQHFRREIEWRAGQIRRRVVLKLSTSAEVHQQDAPVFGSHHVVRLDIPMEQAGGMHRRHCATQLETYVDCLGGADHLAPLERLLERVATNELHPEADVVANL